MTNLRTNLDIIEDALFNAGEETNSSSDYYSRAIIFYNRFYQEICSGGSALDPDAARPWWWLRKSTPGILTLQPAVVSPTVTATAGSPLITYSTPPTDRLGNQISVQGYFFFVDSDNGDYYRILSHISGQTQATLDQDYTGSDQSAAAQHTIKFQYALADDCKSVVGRMRAYQENRDFIDMSDLDPMRTQFPLRTRPTGLPILFSMVAEQTVEFSHYVGDNSTDVARVEYDYLVIPSDLADDSNSPLLPFQYRPLLSDYVTYLILMNKDDNKSSAYLSSAQARLQAMVKEHDRRVSQTSNNFGKIMPRQRDLRRYDAPLRTQSGLIIG